MKKLSSVILLLFVFTGAFATNHIITFGSANDFTYTPNTLVLNVGDTITWQGDFNVHPLVSTSIPEGAIAFRNYGGTTYSYIVTVSGFYYYQSTNNQGQITKGVFRAGTIANPVVVNGDATSTLYISRDNETNVLYTGLADTSATGFTITIFNMAGQMVTSSVVNFSNSKYTMPNLATGIYIVRVTDVVGHTSAIKMWQP